MKVIDKIIVSPTAPKNKNAAWFDGKSIKMPSQGKWESAGGSGESPTSIMINVTYEELVRLRNERKLTPGAKYRMTDYETTCTWENTQVAGHPFDLVLTALDNKTLDEKCSAIWSERDIDGYFANSNLAAWDVRYCLDNNINRFEWALIGGTVLKVSAMGQEFEAIGFEQSLVIDGTTYYLWAGMMDGELAIPFLSKTPVPKVGDELYITRDGETISDTAQVIDSYEKMGGKGVIYRLIDESENSVPYDFKNIMFMRPLTDGEYDAENGVDTFCYTFCCIDVDTYAIKDQSVKEPYCCYNNKFAPYCIDNVFLTFSEENCYNNTFGGSCGSNTFGYDCYNNTFGDVCSSNTFGYDCYNNTFGHDCYNNTFGDECSSNTFGHDYYYNTFGNECKNNKFDEACRNNTFGNSCSSNTFGDRCSSNTFGNSCSSNTFGNSCSSNTFGDRCSSNTFGDECKNNKFDEACYSNTFGNGCKANYFGFNCHSVSTHRDFNNAMLGHQCSYITFGKECTSITLGEYGKSFYAQHIEFKDGVRSVTLQNTESRSHHVQNYVIISAGYQSTINVVRDRYYKTYVDRDKNGNTIEYTIDDLIGNTTK